MRPIFVGLHVEADAPCAAAVKFLRSGICKRICNIYTKEVASLVVRQNAESTEVESLQEATLSAVKICLLDFDKFKRSGNTKVVIKLLLPTDCSKYFTKPLILFVLFRSGGRHHSGRRNGYASWLACSVSCSTGLASRVFATRL